MLLLWEGSTTQKNPEAFLQNNVNRQFTKEEIQKKKKLDTVQPIRNQEYANQNNSEIPFTAHQVTENKKIANVQSPNKLGTFSHVILVGV